MYNEPVVPIPESELDEIVALLTGGAKHLSVRTTTDTYKSNSTDDPKRREHYDLVCGRNYIATLSRTMEESIGDTADLEHMLVLALAKAIGHHLGKATYLERGTYENRPAWYIKADKSSFKDLDASHSTDYCRVTFGHEADDVMISLRVFSMKSGSEMATAVQKLYSRIASRVSSSFHGIQDHPFYSLSQYSNTPS